MELSIKNWFPKRNKKPVKVEQQSIAVVTNSQREFEEFSRENRIFSDKLNTKYFKVSSPFDFRGKKFDHMIFIYGWRDVDPRVIDDCLNRVEFKNKRKSEPKDSIIKIVSLVMAIIIAGIIWSFAGYLFLQLMIKLNAGNY